MKQHIRNFSKLTQEEAHAISEAFLAFANGMPVEKADEELVAQVNNLAKELGRSKDVSYLIGRLGDYQVAYTKAFKGQSDDKVADAFYDGVQTGMNFMAGVAMLLDGRIDQAGLQSFLEDTEKDAKAKIN
ncbi:hypothetical protein [Periweissella beninensis]|uniref:hypothetical protein n=1 Tax=Periweissella beninensis TaxID=504936 RepID=UPI0021A7C2A1|nr:hypothetical protein [Periweissella beninensis]MCT4396300.1 hypothetical protein [Periweissella beninensis]